MLRRLSQMRSARPPRLLIAAALVAALLVSGCEAGDDPPRFAGGDLLPEGTVTEEVSPTEPATGLFTGESQGVRFTFNVGRVTVRALDGASDEVTSLFGQSVKVTCGESLDRGATGVTRWPRGSREATLAVSGTGGERADTRLERCWLQPVPATNVLAVAKMQRRQ